MGNLHQGGPEHAVVEPVPWLHLLDDGAFLVLIGLLARDRLVLGRVELLADRGDGREALALQDIVELPDDQLDALEPVAVDALRGMLERALKVVSERQQLAQQLLVRELGTIREVLARAPLVILEIGREPLVATESRQRFVTSRLKLWIYWLSRLGLADRLTLCRRAGPGVRHAGAAWCAARGHRSGGSCFDDMLGFLPIALTAESVSLGREEFRSRLAHQADSRHDLPVRHPRRPDHTDRAPHPLVHLVRGQHQAALAQPAAGVLTPDDDLDILVEGDLLQNPRQLGALLQQLQQFFEPVDLDELWM